MELGEILILFAVGVLFTVVWFALIRASACGSCGSGSYRQPNDD